MLPVTTFAGGGGYTVTIDVLLDNNAYTANGKTFHLHRVDGGASYTEAGGNGTVIFSGVEPGTYDLLDGPTDTGVDITVVDWNVNRQLTYHTVTFEFENNTDEETQIVIGGKTVSDPGTPTKTGYVFSHWATYDAGVYYPFDITNQEIGGTITLYAQYTAVYPSIFDPLPDPRPTAFVAPAYDYNAGPPPSPPSAALPPYAAVVYPGHEDAYVKISANADLNESGSLNSRRAMDEIMQVMILKTPLLKDVSGMEYECPEGTLGMSESTTKKIVAAAGDVNVTITAGAVSGGETIGSISVPLTEQSGQILTEIAIGTARTAQAEEYIKDRWNLETLGIFETAQQGGWGSEATITIAKEKLGFFLTFDDLTSDGMIFDFKTQEWHEIDVEMTDDDIIIKTPYSGIVALVTEPVK